MQSSKESSLFDLRKKIQESLEELRDELSHSILFLDSITQEVIKWAIPIDVLYNEYHVEHILTIQPDDIYEDMAILEEIHRSYISTRSTEDLDPDELPDPVDQFPSKAVFFIGSFLFEYIGTFSSLFAKFPFPEVIIYCALTEEAHKYHPNMKEIITEPEHQNEPFNFFMEELKQTLTEAMETRSIKAIPLVAIVALPSLSVSSMTPGLFFLPTCWDCFPVLHLDFTGQESGVPARLTPEMVPESLKNPLNSLAHTLYSLFSWLNVKEDIYPLGYTSRYIAKELQSIHRNLNTQTNIPSPESREQTHIPISLLLIDRTLDLVNPCIHSDNILDRIYAVIGNTVPEYSTDVQVNMNFVFPNFTVPLGDQKEMLHVVPGSLSHPSDKLANTMLEILSTKREKDAINEICKKMLDVFTKEKIQVQLAKMGTGVKQLTGFLDLLSKDPSLFYKYNPILQTLSAVVQAMKQSPSIKWDEILSIEKIMMLSVTDEGQSLLSRILEVYSRPVPGSPSAKFSVYDILVLSLMAYSLMGEKGFDRKDERALQEAISKSLLEIKSNDLPSWLGETKQSLMNYQHNLTNSQRSEDRTEDLKQLQYELSDKIDDAFSKLHDIANSRTNLADFKHLLKPGGKSGPYTSLISQVLSQVFDEKRGDSKDLEKLSAASIGTIFSRSIFGMGSAKPKSRLTDNNTIIIFVIGGITFSEIREIRELLISMKVKSQVIIGSTAVATASHVYERTFNQ